MAKKPKKHTPKTTLRRSGYLPCGPTGDLRAFCEVHDEDGVVQYVDLATMMGQPDVESFTATDWVKLEQEQRDAARAKKGRARAKTTNTTE